MPKKSDHDDPTPADATSRITRSRRQITTLVIQKAKMVVTRGPDTGKEYIIDPNLARIRIGTQPNNEMILTDDTVSRQHAELVQQEGGYLVRDLGSTNGTFIDDLAVKEAFLKPGATIRIGNSEVRLIPLKDRWQIRPTSQNRLGDLLGTSLAMREVFGLIKKVSNTDLTVILTGETGTGKELAARVIHGLSRRHAAPFVVVDCGAIAPDLVESELFGHEKGAFTGAVAAREGSFEQAKGGTLFLDEIGELGLDLQPKLLRVLEQREVKRVGGNQMIPVDVRVIAATHRDLSNEVRKGNFRQDLFFRLSVIQIPLPPLRERIEDIPLLIDRFLRDFPGSQVNSSSEIPKEGMSALQQYAWPGNVRELRNLVERAITLGETMDFKGLLESSPVRGEADRIDGGPAAPASLEEVERNAIIETLKATKGNKKAAARSLGIAYSTLYEKLKKYGL